MGPDSKGGKIVVGVDGSQSSRRAAAWALDEARARQVPLDVVCVWELPPVAYGAAFVPPPIDRIIAAGRARLDEAMAAFSTEDVVVTPRIIEGPPASILAEISREPDVEMLVVGSRGRSGAAEVVLGSLSHYLTHHSGVPLVVVPNREPEDADRARAGRILVGADGSPDAARAVRWAADEARIHDTNLEIVVAWSVVESPRPKGARPGEPLSEALARCGAELVDRLLQDLSGSGVRAGGTVAEGSPAEVLTERATDARLLVVGSRGRGRAREALLGSVSHSCVHRAPVPVAVIR